MGIVNRILAALKYNAIESRPTRRPIYVSLKSEDRELPSEKRRRLISESARSASATSLWRVSRLGSIFSC